MPRLTAPIGAAAGRAGAGSGRAGGSAPAPAPLGFGEGGEEVLQQVLAGHQRPHAAWIRPSISRFTASSDSSARS